MKRRGEEQTSDTNKRRKVNAPPKRIYKKKKKFEGYYVWYNDIGVAVREHDELPPEDMEGPIHCAHFDTRKKAIAKPFNELTIYTDGSSKNNNRDSGYGVFWGIDDIRNVSMRMVGTNNAMEAQAMLHALEQWHVMPRDDFEKLVIYTDSNLTMNAVAEPGDWFRRIWEPNGESETRKNYEVYEKIVRLLDKEPNVSIRHVKSHIGIYGNERADDLAGKAGSERETSKTPETTADEPAKPKLISLSRDYVFV